MIDLRLVYRLPVVANALRKRFPLQGSRGLSQSHKRLVVRKRAKGSEGKARRCRSRVSSSRSISRNLLRFQKAVQSRWLFDVVAERKRRCDDGEEKGMEKGRENSGRGKDRKGEYRRGEMGPPISGRKLGSITLKLFFLGNY